MNNSSPVQLSLGITLKDEATFANFFVANERNAVAVKALQQFCNDEGDQNLVIWGAKGSGLTHLLQACSHTAQLSNQDIQYLPLRDIKGYSPTDVCECLDSVKLLCLDGIDEICGSKEWEQALFHLFNRVRDAGNRLLISMHTSPPSLPILLADLKSRILGGVVYHVEGLDDDSKVKALQMRAKVRGLELPDEVVQFVLNRAPRDMNELFNILNRLDDASLQHQRKLTIPFIKQVMKF